MYYIYKIENTLNHKVYIGLTNNIKRRRARHFTDLRCHRHDNSFLQKEFDRDGEDNFTFSIEFEGEVTPEEIGEKEKEYIKKYDSYYNGYNQNEGGNFGPSNGGSHLTKSDIFNICAALEFCFKPGGVLSQIYDVSLTTISRIKHKVNHNEIIEEYDNLSEEERKAIYKIFCDSSDFYSTKLGQTIQKNTRKLNKEQVFKFLYNEEHHLVTTKSLCKEFDVDSNVFSLIRRGITYKDFKYMYDNLDEQEKQKIVSLFSNK